MSNEDVGTSVIIKDWAPHRIILDSDHSGILYYNAVNAGREPALYIIA
jgi:hypothetical protein